MRAPWRSLAVIAVAALAAAGCSDSGSGDSGDSSAVKIGLIDPTSGANAPTGQDARNGAALAVDVINGEFPDIDLPLAAEAGLPNLNGAKIELKEGDSGGDPQTGANEADRLVTDEGVVALTGAYQSSVTKTISERAEALQVPMVNGDSSSTALTQQGLDWFFRTGPHDETFGEGFFTMLKELQGAGEEVTDVAILHTDDDFGSDGAEVTAQLASDNGFDVVANVGYNKDATDLTQYVQQIKSKNPQVLFVLSYIADSLVLAKTFQQLDYTPPAVLGYGAGFSDPTFVDTDDKAALATGFCRRSAWSQELAERNPTAKAIADMFQEKFDAPMTENSARTFTAMMTLAQAINDAGSTDADKVRAALQNTDIPGRDTIMPWDGIKFDDNHQNSGARGVIEQFIDGKWTVVSPSDVSGGNKVAFPLSQTRS